jgi:CubicO group peptidase (beta-lactamase class C family)
MGSIGGSIGRRTVLAGALASGVVGRVRADETGLAAPVEAAMAAHALAFMDAHRVPGLSVAIAKARRLVWRRAFGLADRAAGEPLTVDHRFRIGSISKPITATTVFALIERGRLRLDDRVLGPGGVLGTAYGTPPYSPGLAAITLDHLLTHTAGGWPNDGTDPMFSLDARWPVGQLIGWTLDNRPQRSPPGTAYAYSNFGFCLLGRVIETVTGQRYADAVRQAALAPCGITDMRIAGNTLADRAPGEVVYHDQERRDPYGLNVARMDSHGGWIATATELLRLTARLSTAPDGGGLLKPETIATMTTPSPVERHYARGWQLTETGTWWHGGSLPGTSTLLVRAGGGLGWAALCNTRDARGIRRALDQTIWRMIREVPDWPAGAPL